jgi:hypothetical protein
LTITISAKCHTRKLPNWIKYPSIWLTHPNQYFNPEKGVQLYRRYLDEHAYAETVGFDGLMVNEHHNTPPCMHAAPNITASALIQRTRIAKILTAGQRYCVVGEPGAPGRRSRDARFYVRPSTVYSAGCFAGCGKMTSSQEFSAGRELISVPLKCVILPEFLMLVPLRVHSDRGYVSNNRTAPLEYEECNKSEGVILKCCIHHGSCQKTDSRCSRR